MPLEYRVSVFNLSLLQLLYLHCYSLLLSLYSVVSMHRHTYVNPGKAVSPMAVEKTMRFALFLRYKFRMNTVGANLQMLCLGVELSLESCGLDISPLHILPQCGKYSFRPDVLKVLSVDSQCLFRYFQGVCKVKTFHTNTRSFPPTFSLFLTFAKVMMGKPGILT